MEYGVNSAFPILQSQEPRPAKKAAIRFIALYHTEFVCAPIRVDVANDNTIRCLPRWRSFNLLV